MNKDSFETIKCSKLETNVTINTKQGKKFSIKT